MEWALLVVQVLLVGRGGGAFLHQVGQQAGKTAFVGKAALAVPHLALGREIAEPVLGAWW